MDYKNMDTVDLKLHLLSGEPIEVSGIKVNPFTLREIVKYGYNDYMKLIQWLMITKEDFIKATVDLENRLLLESQKSSLTTFDFYFKLSGETFRKNLLIAMSVLFKTEDIRVLGEAIAINFIKDGLLEYKGEGELVLNEERLEELGSDNIKLIHKDNFDDFIQVFKIQNYLDKVSSAKGERKFNPADENAKRIAEDLERMRKKVEEKKANQKRQEESEIDISDIIDAVSSKSSSINKLNIWDLTIYQLYAEYARLELIDSYNFSVKAIMAGGKDIEIKHWSSKNE